MSEIQPTVRRSQLKLALAAIAAICSISLALFQYVQTRPTTGWNGTRSSARRQLSIVKTDDGRQLLWARGPRDVAKGEWFDITDSPLDSKGYQYGIGKDSIPAIDRPKFVAINEQQELAKYGIRDATHVIGYEHNGAAKAYPIGLMNRHELVNDEIGGKPVTVGW